MHELVVAAFVNEMDKFIFLEVRSLNRALLMNSELQFSVGAST